jgi:hypothetical protein
LHFEISQYEFRVSNRDDWQRVPEKFVLEKLVDVFDPISPLLTELIQGKEVTTPKGIFRMKKSGNKRKDY